MDENPYKSPQTHEPEIRRKRFRFDLLMLFLTTVPGFALVVMSPDKRMMGPLDNAGFALIFVGGIGALLVGLYSLARRK